MPFWRELLTGSSEPRDDDLDDDDDDPIVLQPPEQPVASAPVYRGTGGGDLYQGVAEIRDRDPAFDPHAFLAEVEALYLRAQQAWGQGGDGGLEKVVNPSFLPRWRQLLEAWRSGGKPVIFESPAPPNIRFQRAEADANYDMVTMHLTATSLPGMPFAEFRQEWTFIRYHITDLSTGNIAQRTCPNCGAPFSVDREGCCTYCHAAFQGAVFDWRLTDVEDVTFGAGVITPPV